MLLSFIFCYFAAKDFDALTGIRADLICFLQRHGRLLSTSASFRFCVCCSDQPLRAPVCSEIFSACGNAKDMSKINPPLSLRAKNDKNFSEHSCLACKFVILIGRCGCLFFLEQDVPALNSMNHDQIRLSHNPLSYYTSISSIVETGLPLSYHSGLLRVIARPNCSWSCTINTLR